MKGRKFGVCHINLQNESRPSLDSSDIDNIDLPSNNRGPDRNADRVMINVGGMRHETFRSTLKIFPDTRLGWIATNGSESIDAYDPVRNEYFFDRHPTAFSQILNFYRTGKLHAPTDICGPLFEEELTYWGLEEKSMEPCCWPKYNEHRDAQENLKVFDNAALNLRDDDDIDHRYEQETEAANNKSFQKFFKAIKPTCFNSRTWLNFKRKTWRVFEDHSMTASFLSKAVSKISLTFILISVFSLCFHSMVYPYPVPESSRNNRTVNQLYSDILFGVDVVSVTWFTAEFTLRFVSSPNRVSFMFQIMNVIDLLTVVPYFIQFSNGRKNYIFKGENNVVEILSVARLFRLFRFFRLSTGLEILKHTLIASSKELLLLLLLLAIPVAIFATIVYYCERNTLQTDFKTIPESLWWAIITMTTVGYGDMSPKTTPGKVFGALCATCSVLILALPVSIIGNNFTLFYHYAQARLKLPKKPKNALVGAANALVAEQSQHSLSPDEDEDNNSADNDSNDSSSPKETLKIDPDFIANNVSYSKRFQRERLSLYVTEPSRRSTRRSRSMGNFVNDSQRSNGNIKLRNKQRRCDVKRHESIHEKVKIEHDEEDERLGMDNVSFEVEHPSNLVGIHKNNNIPDATKHLSIAIDTDNKTNERDPDLERNSQPNISTFAELNGQPVNSTGPVYNIAPVDNVPPDIPTTVITDCDILDSVDETFSAKDEQGDFERNGILNQKYLSIHRQNGTVGRVNGINGDISDGNMAGIRTGDDKLYVPQAGVLP